MKIDKNGVELLNRTRPTQGCRVEEDEEERGEGEEYGAGVGEEEEDQMWILRNNIQKLKYMDGGEYQLTNVYFFRCVCIYQQNILLLELTMIATCQEFTHLTKA